MAFLIPFARDLLCLVKKLTVIGIIGNTQGVSMAANPPKNDKINIFHRPLSSVFSTVVSFVVSSADVELLLASFEYASKLVTSLVVSVLRSNTKNLLKEIQTLVHA